MSRLKVVALGLAWLASPSWAQSDDQGKTQAELECEATNPPCWTKAAIRRLPEYFPVVAVGANEIVVQGAPLPAAKGDIAYDVVAIDRERLQGTASNRIEDALKDVAGLTQFRRSDARSANATSQGATLRGLGGNASSRALVLLDGVPQTDPFGGWITWPAFAPERLGGVRVTRGGGAGAAGPGALAGTIEMVSIGSGSAEGLSGAVSAGSREAFEGQALLAGRFGGGFAFLGANYARGDGFVPIVASQRGPADRRSPYEQASIAARAAVPLSGATEIQAAMLAFTDRRERGTALSQNGGDGADASLRLVHGGRWAWSALAYIQLREFRSRFVSLNAARDTVTPTVDQYRVPSTGIGARFELRPPVGDDFELRVGGDWRRTVGRTNEFFSYVAGMPTRLRIAGGAADTVGTFAEATATLGRVTLTGGARADRWSLGNGRLTERLLAGGAPLRNDIAPDRSGWEGTGRAGLAWANDQVTLRAAAYLGWRLPTLNELHRPFRLGLDATAANPALRPERLRGAEVGIDWRPTDALTVRATGFANALRSAIANVTLAAGPSTFPGVGFVAAGGVYRQRQNLDAVRSNGIELDLSWRRGDLRAQASYALTDARVRGSGLAAPLDGLRPAQIPRHTASATLGWRTLSATARYVAAQFEDDQNIRRLGGAITVDTVATLPLGRGVSLIARGENLFGERVEAAISAAGVIERATPRTFWLGVRFGD